MKEEALLQAERQACMDQGLRGKSALVQQYFDQLEQRMHRKQRMWGGDRTVVTPETEKEPASYRRALCPSFFSEGGRTGKMHPQHFS